MAQRARTRRQADPAEPGAGNRGSFQQRLADKYSPDGTGPTGVVLERQPRQPRGNSMRLPSTRLGSLNPRSRRKP